MGYDIVRIKLIEGNPKTLQIMAERKTDKKLNIDDCSAISRAISAILDVEDPIKDGYSLEVSSPGIDRPLVKLADFKEYSGKLVKISTKYPVEGRKRFKGLLTGIKEGKDVQIKVDEQDFSIDPDNIVSANLIITDELIKEHAEK